MLRHTTGNKPLHLTELHFLKREIWRNTKAFQKKILLTDSLGSSTSKLPEKADSATEANGIHIQLVEIYWIPEGDEH